MKNSKLWIAVAAAVFIAALVWCVIILTKPQGEIVTISQDGKTLYTLDLSEENDRTITIEYEGRKNVVEIKDGRIHMLEADCPDHTCTTSGWLEDLPIVCLPNKLVIEFADADSADAVAR